MFYFTAQCFAFVWSLTKDETINTYDNCHQKLEYTLSLDRNCAHILVDEIFWQKKTAANPNRGLQDDPETGD